MKICPVGAELFHAEIRRLSHFAVLRKRRKSYLMYTWASVPGGEAVGD